MIWCFALCASVFGFWSLVFDRTKDSLQNCNSTPAREAKTKNQRPKTICLIKLFQKAHVILEEQTNVVESVHQRYHAVNSQAKSKSGKLGRIDASSAQNVGVNHARPAKFYPSRVLANATTSAAALETTEVEFCARFCKRKIRRPKPRDRLRAKHPAQKLSHRALQMCHADSAIHAETFNLKKHRVVGWVRRIAAKDSAGSYHSQGRTTALHRMNLHGRGLRTQSKTLAGVKRILRSTRRMIVRNVQCVEVIEIRFDFASVLNRIPERHENVFDSFPDHSDRMKMSASWPPAGKGDVYGFAFGFQVVDEAPEIQLCFVERICNPTLQALNFLVCRGAMPFDDCAYLSL